MPKVSANEPLQYQVETTTTFVETHPPPIRKTSSWAGIELADPSRIRQFANSSEGSYDQVHTIPNIDVQVAHIKRTHDALAEGVLRAADLPSVLRRLEQLAQEATGSVMRSAHAGMLINLCLAYWKRSPSDLLARALKALHDGLAYEHKWDSVSASQYKAVYEHLEKIANQQFGRSDFRAFLQVLSSNNIDPIPFYPAGHEEDGEQEEQR